MIGHVGISAEFVAIMKAESDSRYEHFISTKAKIIHSFAKTLLPERSLHKILADRLALSTIFDEEIRRTKPDQIIDLGCGYSLRGYDLCKRNPDLIYVDMDLHQVISKKRRIIEKISTNDPPQNYRMVEINVLKDRLYPHVLKGKKTLVLAEGVSSYFDNDEFDEYIGNVRELIDDRNVEFFSHEELNIRKSTIYRMLRFMIKILTRSRTRKKFENADELSKYLKGKGLRHSRILRKGDQLIYSIRNI